MQKSNVANSLLSLIQSLGRLISLRHPAVPQWAKRFTLIHHHQDQAQDTSCIWCHMVTAQRFPKRSWVPSTFPSTLRHKRGHTPRHAHFPNPPLGLEEGPHQSWASRPPTTPRDGFRNQKDSASMVYKYGPTRGCRQDGRGRYGRGVEVVKTNVDEDKSLLHTHFGKLAD